MAKRPYCCGPLTAAIACILSLCLVTTKAGAEILTYDFNGEISSFTGAFQGLIPQGTVLPVTGSLSFESTTPPLAGGSSNLAGFLAITDFKIDVASELLSATEGIIAIGNDQSGMDSFRAASSVLSGGVSGDQQLGLPLLGFEIVLRDSSQSAFATALTLPTTLGLTLFDGSSINIIYGHLDQTDDKWGFLGGQITAFAAAEVTAVPLPSTVSLLIAGFGVLGFSARRARRQVPSAFPMG